MGSGLDGAFGFRAFGWKKMKTHIEKNTVQETLVIPLYGRKLCNEQFPDLFRDEKAVELIDRIDYDFSALEKKSKSFAHRFP